MRRELIVGFVSLVVSGLLGGCGGGGRKYGGDGDAGSAGSSGVDGSDTGGRPAATGGAAGDTATGGAAGGTATGGAAGDTTTGGAAGGPATGGAAGEPSTGGAAGEPATGGAAGEGAAGGAAGEPAAGGSAGEPATGGAAGEGAAGGAAGEPATGGSAGEPATGGAAGEPGASGSAGEGGAAGEPATGGAAGEPATGGAAGEGGEGGVAGSAAVADCGNGSIEGLESCDGANLDSNNCTTLGMGFNGGTLACIAAGQTNECTFDTSNCWTGTSLSAGPGLEIPDSGAIWDMVQVTGGCTISDLSVDLDLTHTWIGDLIIELTSPAGTTVRLHNRTGSSTDDIVGNYPGTLTVDGPGTLADFAGESSTGWWRLDVSDNSGADVGMLNGWTVNIDCGATTDVATASPGVPVSLPDYYLDGIVDTLLVSSTSCTITDINLDIDLTHTWRGDLIVELVSPAGTSVRLHNRTGDSDDDIIGNYPLTLTEDGTDLMSDFVGESLDGYWQLLVSDNSTLDLGTLNSWTLNAACE